MSVASAVIARGQQTWLALFGEPTRRAAAPTAPPVMAVRVIPGVDDQMFQGVSYDTTRVHLVCAKGALGELEPDTVIVHGTERMRVQSGPIPLEPDGGLVAYPVLVGEA